LLDAKAAALTWDPRDSFKEVREFGWKKITTLFSLNHNRNLAFHSIMNVSNEVICGL
jgi:hypothetical protein